MEDMKTAVKRTSLLALAAIAFSGCQPPPGARPAAVAPRTSNLIAGRETVITAAEIAQMGASTAWDVVRMRAPRLTFTQAQNGKPATVRIQEPRSVNADETPLLVVDGARVGDISYLDDIPASDVRVIRIMDGEGATQLYGISAASGAIVVETKQGR